MLPSQLVAMQPSGNTPCLCCFLAATLAVRSRFSATCWCFMEKVAGAILVGWLTMYCSQHAHSGTSLFEPFCHSSRRALNLSRLKANLITYNAMLGGCRSVQEVWTFIEEADSWWRGNQSSEISYDLLQIFWWMCIRGKGFAYITLQNVAKTMSIVGKPCFCGEVTFVVRHFVPTQISSPFW